MGLLDIVIKIGRVVAAPIKVITQTVSDWAHEPLKRLKVKKKRGSIKIAQTSHNETITASPPFGGSGYRQTLGAILFEM